MPQIFLIGATGRTGKLVLEEALTRGHAVTVIVRKPNTSLLQHADLNVVTGDPCNPTDIEKALRSTKSGVPVVIISTLGQTRTSGNPWAAPTSPAGFMKASASAVLAAAQAVEGSVQIDKLVVMSMFGIGDSFKNLNFLLRWTMRHSNMVQTIEDQTLVDEAVRKGHLPFVLIRPALLTEGDAAPVKVYSSSAEGVGIMPKVSVKSVAKFLMDAASKGDWDGTSPVITN
ncbi:uncharacterized protein PV06_09986 [Exophiala oligosperma]|uniref:NAD(P)-binding domain-containing protein n=1 Tax=Exophiala oligosperma TaxID=215243 RepID=A0A0D2D6N8_9EURO|nr:uncharacterized protein PV06_09986 [Exophiala oligosperma]KIW38010.1 hypothetical protein PV06_09986 [Exophiala oligosperma]